MAEYKKKTAANYACNHKSGLNKSINQLNVVQCNEHISILLCIIEIQNDETNLSFISNNITLFIYFILFYSNKIYSLEFNSNRDFVSKFRSYDHCALC